MNGTGAVVLAELRGRLAEAEVRIARLRAAVRSIEQLRDLQTTRGGSGAGRARRRAAVPVDPAALSAMSTPERIVHVMTARPGSAWSEQRLMEVTQVTVRASVSAALQQLSGRGLVTVADGRWRLVPQGGSPERAAGCA